MDVDWAKMLAPDTPLLEILARGTLVYLALFAMLRILRRQSSELGTTDLLVVVLIADAAQNAMADDYTSVTDGVLLVAVIIAWAFVIDLLSFRVRWIERLVAPPPRPLVRRGRIVWANMRKELVTLDELMSQLRLNGVESVHDVRSARLESDGRLSVVTNSGSGGPEKSDQRT